MTNQIERALVIDESDANVLFWEMLLPEFKLTVFKSRAGAEALELIERENIQLAIVTWELSSMSGAVLIQKAKATRRRRHMPFLIYSKRMTDADVKIAKEMGVENIIGMPFDKAQIRTVLQEILDKEKNLSAVEVKLRKMEEYLEIGRPAEVLKMIGPDVSKNGPHLPRYKAIVGETFLQIGHLDKAMKAADESLAADPNYLPAHYLKARLYTSTGRHDESIAVLKTLTEKTPNNIQSLLNLGSAFVSADKIEEAKETVGKIQLLDSANKDVNDISGKIALKEGNLPLAAQLLSETKNGDDIARFYNSLGISMVAKGDYALGIETYQSAIKILQNKAKLHLLLFNLALAYRKKGDLSKELSFFCQSYVAEPAFEKAYACVARGVQEASQKGVTLNADMLRDVSQHRKQFLESNPGVAQKIKERLEASSKAG